MYLLESQFVSSLLQELVTRIHSWWFDFIGRNEEYLDMSIRFTRDVNSDRLVMNRVPRFLKPYVS